jgi:hypothetical protein
LLAIHRGAINAYSRALQVDDSLVAVRSNRAACFLSLRDHAACEADCLIILKQLQPQIQRDLGVSIDSASGDMQMQPGSAAVGSNIPSCPADNTCPAATATAAAAAHADAAINRVKGNWSSVGSSSSNSSSGSCGGQLAVPPVEPVSKLRAMLVKTWVRRGSARLGRGDLQGAERDLEQALR